MALLVDSVIPALRNRLDFLRPVTSQKFAKIRSLAFTTNLVRRTFRSSALHSSKMTEQTQVPEGFKLHTENTSNILLSANEAFLNPVQEFNRDLSVACIRVWSEETNRVKEERWRRSLERKANRRQKKQGSCSLL